MDNSLINCTKDCPSSVAISSKSRLIPSAPTASVSSTALLIMAALLVAWDKNSWDDASLPPVKLSRSTQTSMPLS